MIARVAAALLFGLAFAAATPGIADPVPGQAETPQPRVLPTGVPKPPAAAVLDGQEVEGILGKVVQSRKGEKMGEIIDVIVDPEGHVRAALIDFGGFLGVGSRKLAIDWKAIHFVSGAKSFRVVVDLTRDELADAPAYEAGKQTVILQAPPPPTPHPQAPAKPKKP